MKNYGKANVYDKYSGRKIGSAKMDYSNGLWTLKIGKRTFHELNTGKLCHIAQKYNAVAI